MSKPKNLDRDYVTTPPPDPANVPAACRAQYNNWLLQLDRLRDLKLKALETQRLLNLQSLKTGQAEAAYQACVAKQRPAAKGKCKGC